MSSWEDDLVDKATTLNINAKEFVPNFLIKKNPNVEINEPFKGDEDITEHETATKETGQEDSPDELSEESKASKVNDTNITPTEDDALVQASKEFVNIVFVGHVDAGKSTIGGHILYLTGMVDERDMEKNKKKAAEMNRETWYLSWALDVNEDERAKGKTVECGRSYFETPNKHFTLLDAPGHKSYVNHMIFGSSQADIAVLVISARIGEFEAGFEKGGQTQEHAEVVKTSGVKRLIVLINKMDDPSVEWSEARYNDIKSKLAPFLKKTGFNPKTDVHFMPCSGFLGYFIKDNAPQDICPWYSGPTLLDYLDSMPALDRNINGPLRVTVQDISRDMGVFIDGKIESGVMKKNQTVTIMPLSKQVDIIQILKDEEDSSRASAGDNIRMKIKNLDDDVVMSGFVICASDNLCKVTRNFIAKVQLKDAESILTVGFQCMMHVHSLIRNVAIKHILCIIDPKNPKVPKVKNPKFIQGNDRAIVQFEVCEGVICIENYADFQQMGRFILRLNTQTIGQGMVMKCDIVD